MTGRGVLLGLCLALLMCGFTYYNNEVLQQTFFVSNHLPIGIFGTLMVLLFLLNPLLARVRPSAALAPGDFAVAAALGLAVCCWPYENGFRNFTPSLALQNNQYQVETSWRGAAGMSYVPGGDPAIAEGFVTDFARLRPALARALTSGGFPGEIASRLSTTAKRSVVEPLHPHYLSEAERRTILSALNDVISRDDLAPFAPKALRTDARVARLLSERGELEYLAAELRKEALSTSANDETAAQARKLAFHRATRAEHQAERAKQRVNRALVERAFLGMITPAPAGRGVIVDGGLDDSYTPTSSERS
jgi:hypothetical protein